MRVIAANSALRFYANDGWTQEILDSCLEKGVVEYDDRTQCDPYYRLSVGGKFNTTELLKHVSEIKQIFESSEKTMQQIIEEYNW